MTRKEAFKAKCILASEKALGCSRMYFYDDPRPDDVFEDDGNLHVRKDGVRACFDVNIGQDESGEEQNKKTRAVLEALNMRSKITDRVLVEEDEEEEEHSCDCEYCGR